MNENSEEGRQPSTMRSRITEIQMTILQRIAERGELTSENIRPTVGTFTPDIVEVLKNEPEFVDERNIALRYAPNGSLGFHAEAAAAYPTGRRSNLINLRIIPTAEFSDS